MYHFIISIIIWWCMWYNHTIIFTISISIMEILYHLLNAVINCWPTKPSIEPEYQVSSIKISLYCLFPYAFLLLLISITRVNINSVCLCRSLLCCQNIPDRLFPLNVMSLFYILTPQTIGSSLHFHLEKCNFYII